MKRWLLLALSVVAATLLSHKKSPPPEPKALPASTVDEPEQGQGQALVVIALALAGLLPIAIALVFLMPPAFVAPSLAFGPVILFGVVVIVTHLRQKGLSLNQPPNDDAASGE